MRGGGWHQTQYQESLEHLLHQIFPKHNIISNQRRHDASGSSKNYEVDVSVPKLNLFFEFQDLYHYKPSWYHQMSLEVIQKKDGNKRSVLMKDYKTLVTIPCWWGGDAASLQATILFHRPDLEGSQLHFRMQTKYAVVYHITLNPPASFFPEENDNFSPLMLASFPESISSVNAVENGEWWIGEKWDGIRCVWDTTDKQLYSRNQVAIDLSLATYNSMGNLVLDAELWCGRGFFEESQAVMFTTLMGTDISCVRLVCFDEASLSTQCHPFETRYSILLSNLPESHPAVTIAPRVWSSGTSLIHNMMHDITTECGEGVILQKPLSLYRPGRSDSLFKLKTKYAHTEQEALVLQVGDDGSLLLKQPNGTTFKVEKYNCVLPRPPVQNEIVTLKQDLSTPVWYRSFQKLDEQDSSLGSASPIVYRIRSDLSWDDVLQNQGFLYGDESRTQNDTPNSKGNTASHFSWQRISERREFFDKFATSMGIDPLKPSFWYKVSRRDLLQFDTRFHSIYNLHGGTLPTILMQLYPDIGLQQSLFKDFGAKLSWKLLLNKYASFKGMDPLNPIFWSTVNTNELRQFDKELGKVGNNKLRRIISEMYPNTATGQFGKQPKSPQNKRAIFDQFAAQQGMDPLNPIFWRAVKREDVLRFYKGHKSVFKYGETIAATISRLYPELQR